MYIGNIKYKCIDIPFVKLKSALIFVLLIFALLFPLSTYAQTSELVMTDPANDISSLLGGTISDPDIDLKEGYARQDNSNLIISMVVYGNIRFEESLNARTSYILNITNLDETNSWCAAEWCAGNAQITNNYEDFFPIPASVNSNNLTITIPKNYLGGANRVIINFETNYFNYYNFDVRRDLGTSSQYIIHSSNPDFGIIYNPAYANVTLGSGVNFSISIEGISGFNSQVELSTVNLDSSLTCVFSKTNLYPGENSTLTVLTSKIGNFIINVSGTSGSITHVVSIICSVVLEKDFLLNCTDNMKEITQGDEGQFYINVEQINGFDDLLTFSCSNLPDGFNFNISQKHAKPPCTLILRISVNYAFPGTYMFSFNANSSDKMHAITLSIRVIETPPGLMLSKPVFEPGNVVPNGTSVKITTKVTNLGNNSAKGIVVKYYLHSPEIGNLIGIDSIYSEIKKGESVNSSMTRVFTTKEISETYELYVETNSSYGLVRENGSVTVENVKVDVVEISCPGSYHEGEKKDVKVVVRATGNIPCKYVCVELKVNSSKDIQIERKIVSEIGIKETKWVEFEIYLHKGRMHLSAYVVTSEGYITNGIVVEKDIFVEEKTNLIPILILILFAFLSISFAFYFLRKRRRIVEDMFLIYNDGRLITHFTRRLDTVDNEVLSAMLTALQDFTKDSFKNKIEGSLDEFKYGELRFVIERGKYTLLAVGIKNECPNALRIAMKKTINEIESSCSHVFVSWDGRLNEVSAVKSIVKKNLGDFISPDAFR